MLHRVVSARYGVSELVQISSLLRGGCRCMLSVTPQAAAQQPVPQSLQDAFECYPKLTVAKVPGAGRGLMAAAPISYGEAILVERPLLSFQSNELEDKVCYGCLALLDPTTTVTTSPLSSCRFCSEACANSSEARFHAMESLAHNMAATPSGGSSPARMTAAVASGDCGGSSDRHQDDPMSAFEAVCNGSGERFPLMAARLAFQRLTRAVMRQQRLAHVAQDMGTETGRVVVGGDAVTDLGFLCFANVAKPYPDHWVSLHSLLRQALEAAVVAAELQLQQMSVPQPTGSRVQASGKGRGQVAGPAVASALRAELDLLDLDWFVSVLSRLHINVFRVGCMLPPSGERGDGALWPALGAATSGSAVFLTASLFNHSCEPNIEVVFRRNDDTATFVAARDIDQGEQLFVSYLDESMSLKLRQDHLTFSYGFKCTCQRCEEEAEDLQQATTLK